MAVTFQMCTVLHVLQVSLSCLQTVLSACWAFYIFYAIEQLLCILSALFTVNHLLSSIDTYLFTIYTYFS